MPAQHILKVITYYCTNTVWYNT